MRLNNLTTTNLDIGQQLKVPAISLLPEEMDYILYTVKSGDSLYKIASQYNTTVNAIMDYNNLKSNLLSVDQILKIPKDNGNIPPSETPNPDYIIYTVQGGDSLYKIASQYNTTVNAIMELNQLSTNNLSIGQQLKIPVTNEVNGTRYIVESGDSLWNIAKKYNTTVDAIRKRNNLVSDNLSIGQVLIIP